MMRTDDGLDRRRAWREANVSPLWENALAHGARSFEAPAIWRWRDMKPLIDDALALPGVDRIERRVLSLVNPHPRLPGTPATVTNLNAGLQILAPGEVARPHRHSMNALRFVLAGSGADTIVDGIVCPMSEGDLVLTPGWTWHEHEHRGSEPIVWLDVLDVQLHLFLGTDAFEPGPPHDIPAPAVPPVYRFPRVDAVAAGRAAAPDRDGARRVRYVDPRHGGAVLPTLDCSIVQVDAGTSTRPVRTSAHAVCAVIDGCGSSTIGDTTFAWEPKDVFSVPDGVWATHAAAEAGDARLFVTSDREVLRRLDLLREDVRE
jgi:gentisate 1,2-dioxygenase